MITIYYNKHSLTLSLLNGSYFPLNHIYLKWSNKAIIIIQQNLILYKFSNGGYVKNTIDCESESDGEHQNLLVCVALPLNVCSYNLI